MSTPNLDALPESFVPLDERTNAMLAFVSRQRRLIDGVIAHLISLSTPSPTERVLLPMAWALGNSSGGLERLGRAGHFREAYVVARGLLEAIVNTLFIVAEGDDAALRAERHAKQKAFRDLARSSTIEGQTIKAGLVSLDSSTPPAEIAAAMAEFTTRRGAESQEWTKESIDDRIVVIGRRFGQRTLTELHFARFATYRHASEIVHGTLFAALFAFGMTQPGGPPASGEQLKRHVNDHLSMVLWMSGLAMDAFLRGMAEALAMPDLSEAADASFTLGARAWDEREPDE